MTWFEIYALVWPGIVAILCIAFGYFLAWLGDRAERRRTHHAAE